MHRFVICLHKILRFTSGIFFTIYRFLVAAVKAMMEKEIAGTSQSSFTDKLYID